MAPSAFAERVAQGGHARSTTSRAMALACTAPVLFWALACNVEVETVVGSGPVVRELRAVMGRAGGTTTEPTEVLLASELDLDVRVGRPFAVWIEGHSDLVLHVETEASGARLTIRVPRGLRLVPPPHIELELPALHGLAVRGAGVARVRDAEGEALALTLEGSGDLSATGSVRRLTLAMAGSGDVDLDGLRTLEVDVDKLGSGTARVNASERISGSLVGSGDLIHRGGAQTVRITTVGSASVRPGQ